jgi:N utilization substance protein B
MRKRTKARECALKILYAVDITKDTSPESRVAFWQYQEEADDDVKQFAEKLVKGVNEHRDEIDRVISKYAVNWEMKRMAVIDRNILRFATYELLFVDDIPPKVSINEAIDIAKRYGDKESGKFVNGILDKINKTEGKKAGPKGEPEK